MSQTSSRVGWNGGLGWWAKRQGRGLMDFALFFPFGAIRRSTAIEPYCFIADYSGSLMSTVVHRITGSFYTAQYAHS